MNTKKFPAFFSGTSEFDCPSVAATPEEAAKAFLASKHVSDKLSSDLCVLD